MIVEMSSPTMSPPRSRAPRSEGLHVSSIIKAIASENKVLKPEYADVLKLEEAGSSEVWWNSLDEHSKLRMCMGLAWEEWYLPYLGHVVHQPGEMQVDGIYMTHDGESLDVVVAYELALHEVKVTYKSTKTVGEDIRSQWMWVSQMKAYCKGLTTLIAYLHVLFVCGDYSYPMRPVLRVYKVTFTQAEIDDNWELLTGYVRHQQIQRDEDLMRDTQ